MDTLEKISYLQRENVLFYDEEVYYSWKPYHRVSINVYGNGKQFDAVAQDCYTAGVMCLLKALRSFILDEVVELDNAPLGVSPLANQTVRLPLQQDLRMYTRTIRFPETPGSSFTAECIVDDLRYEADGATRQVNEFVV